MEKIIALLFLLTMPLLAAAPTELFKEGHALYQEGKFHDAGQKYQALRDAGVENWAVEYNLGNTYYRQGQLGMSILHYERAFRLHSAHKDVIYNLGLASNKAGDPRLPESGLLVLAWKLYYKLTLNALTILASLMFIALGFVLVIRWIGRWSVPQEAWVPFVSVGLVLGIWLAARLYEAEHPRGVVVAPVAEVRSGPSLTYPTNFTVPEGHRVLILETQESIQGWLQIGVPKEGLRGWVPDQSVKVI